MSGFRLRPEQQRVIDNYVSGYAAISAVPGAGKTTTLSALAAELIGRIGPRQRVVIVTYQNAAVANFQRAVSDRLQERGMPPRGFIVKTLHSLALEVLSSVRHRAALDTRARVIEDAEAFEIRTDAARYAIEQNRDLMMGLVPDETMRRVARWPDNDPYVLREVLKKAFEELRPYADDLDQFRSRVPTDPCWLPFVLDAFEYYQRHKREQGLMDFDEMVVSAVQALEESPELRERLRNRWPFILEDEAQDSSPEQERMLRLLAGEDGNLVRVGDPNQAILTTFTSSSVEGFRRWLDAPGVQQFELAGSSRSTELILELANTFVKEVHQRFPVEQVRTSAMRNQYIDPVVIDGESHNPSPPRSGRVGLDARFYEGTADERKAIVREAVNYLKNNPDRTVAILVGGRDIGYEYAQDAAEMFPDEKIIRLLSGKDGRPVGLIEKLKPVLNFLERPDGGRHLLKYLQQWSDPHSENRVLPAIERFLSENRWNATGLLYLERGPVTGARLGISGELQAHEQRTLDLLQPVPSWLENRLAEPRELLSLIGATIGISEDERQFFDAIVASVGSVEPDPTVDRLTQLRRILAEIEKSRRRLRGTHEEYEVRIDPGTLTISTRHQAKGLEWDIVYAIGCDDFWFRGDLDFRRSTERPYLGPFDPVLVARTEIRRALDGRFGLPGAAEMASVTEQQAIEEVAEGLRVMYVTLTRAKRALSLSWHRDGFRNGMPEQRFESPVFVMLAGLITDMRLEASSVAAD